MKRHLWSNPSLEWEGFQAVSYWLDFQKVFKLPIDTLLHAGKSGPSTLGNAFSLLRDEKLTSESFESGGLEDELITTDGQAVANVKAPPFNRQLLRLLLELHGERIDIHTAAWYYFERDHCRDEPHESYSFFVVANGKIVRERIGFSDYTDSGFDPTVFEWDNHQKAIWSHDADWAEADTRNWYRRFYSETRTGQLMVLRPDNPALFHYQREGSDLMGALAALTQSLRSVQTLLWVLVIISAISLIIHWK